MTTRPLLSQHNRHPEPLRHTPDLLEAPILSSPSHCNDTTYKLHLSNTSLQLYRGLTPLAWAAREQRQGNELVALQPCPRLQCIVELAAHLRCDRDWNM
jgi:hypothetical protein